MNTFFWTAVVLMAGLALVHSVLGERYILIRLFRRTDLPKLFGSDDFTKRTLRFAWHLTSVVWLGVAAAIFWLAAGDAAGALRVIAATALVSSVVAAVGSRLRHLSWIVFLVVGAAIWFGSNGLGG